MAAGVFFNNFWKAGGILSYRGGCSDGTSIGEQSCTGRNDELSLEGRLSYFYDQLCRVYGSCQFVCRHAGYYAGIRFYKMDMGFIQTCFFAGYALMQVPGGMLAERLGLRRTGALAILWWSVFTALTALAKGKISFAAVRLLFGLGEGPVFRL